MKTIFALVFLFTGSVHAIGCPDRSGVYEDNSGFWVKISQLNCEELAVEQGARDFPEFTFQRNIKLDGKMRPSDVLEDKPDTTETSICYVTPAGFQESYFAILKPQGKDLSWLNIRYDFDFSVDGKLLNFAKRTIHHNGGEFPPWTKSLNKQ